MWLFKRHSGTRVESVVESCVALPTETAKAQKVCPTSYSAIVNYPLDRYPTHDNITAVGPNIRIFKQQKMIATDYEQLSKTKTLRCGSIHTEKMVKGFFVEDFNRSICRPLRRQWSEHQLASLENTSQKMKASTKIYRIKPLFDIWSVSKRTESFWELRTNSGRQCSSRQATNNWQLLPVRAFSRDLNGSASSNVYETTASMFMSGVVPTMEWGELDFNHNGLFAIQPGIYQEEIIEHLCFSK